MTGFCGTQDRSFLPLVFPNGNMLAIRTIASHLHSPHQGIHMHPPLSRRQFAVLAATAAAGTRYSVAAPSAVSVQDLIDRIHKQATPNWPQNYPRGLIAGDSAQPVHGIVTTSQASVDVLRKTVSAGANLIFTCEPTFFSLADGRTPPPSSNQRPGGNQPGISPTDPILLAKKQFIDKNNLVIYRVTDRWKSAEDFSLALGARLGWSKGDINTDVVSYTIPARPLSEVVTEIKSKLSIRGGMRVVGKLDTAIQRVTILPGLHTLADVLQYMPKSDLLLIGETRDWEGAEYSSDVVAAGMKKAYVQVGRIVTEDPGMGAFAEWMQGFTTEVPIHNIPATDPYWRPR
jgi:putative NIF3 family GTP cyclohydrolase 1 type 2